MASKLKEITKPASMKQVNCKDLFRLFLLDTINYRLEKFEGKLPIL